MKTRRFRQLVDQYKDLVYNQAYYFTGNKEDAEDITQDVLLKLWHQMEKVRDNAAKAWLLKVTRHACIDLSRKSRERSLSEFEPETRHQIMNRLQDSAASPEQRIIHDDVLRQGLHALPEQFRSILIMRELQDLPYDLIAETMELPVNTVKVYLHRGRKLLAQTVKAQDGYAMAME